MEKVNARTRAGIAKALGIILCIGGVGILAFYKGPQWKPSFFSHFHGVDPQHHAHVSSSKSWVIGCFLLFFSLAAWALWLVLQVGSVRSIDFSWLVSDCSHTGNLRKDAIRSLGSGWEDGSLNLNPKCRCAFWRATHRSSTSRASSACRAPSSHFL